MPVLVRMYFGEAWEAGYVFVDFWVVFHRTRTQRIKAVVDTEVATGKGRIVTDNVYFVYFWQVRFFLTLEFGWQNVVHIDFRYIRFRQ